MPINCPIFSTDRKKREFDLSERSAITRKILEQQRLERAAMQAPRQVARDAMFNQVRQQAHSQWTRYLSDLTELSPDNLPRMLDKLVSDFGIHNRRLGLDPSLNYTVAGEVRENLLDAKRTIEGLITTAGRISVLEKLQPFVDSFRQQTRQLHIPRRQASELLDDLLTVGQIPSTQSATVYYRHQILGRQSLVDTLQRRRYQDFVSRMQTAGFSKDQIDTFVQQASVVANSFDEIATYARAVGVDIGNIEDIGFFSRQVTKRLQQRLDDIASEELLSELNFGNTTLSSVHNRSRTTFHYIPEDLAFVSDILGVGTREIQDMLDDPIVWRTYLHNNVSADQLNMLVDAGILQKLPMSSREVLDYFRRQFDLPFQLSDAFILDPIENIKHYTNSLQRAAGSSAVLRRMIEGDAFKQGWAISERVWLDNGGRNGQFGRFVPLGDGLDRWVRQARVENITNLEAAMGLQQGYLDSLRNVYVHPIVADQYHSLMEISLSPSLMGQTSNIILNAAKMIQATSTRLLRSVLATPQYVFRTVMQNTVAYHASGGNLAYVPRAFLDLQRLISRGLDVFDNNTKRFLLDGQELTYRELFESFLVNRGHNVAPGTNLTRLNLPTGNNFNPRNMWEAMMGTTDSVTRAMNDMLAYTMAHGDPVDGRKISMLERVGRFGRAAATGADRLLDESFAPFAYWANYFDLMYKWSATLSMARRIDGTEVASRIGQFATSQQFRVFDTTRDLYRHLDEYFVDVYKSGAVTNAVNQYIFPFATWAMANPPMQFRHMFRNPHLYLNYHRLRSFINEPLTEDDDFNDSNVPTWVLEGSPLYLTNDENNNPVVILTDNYDAIGDTFSFVNGVGNTVNRLFGGEAVFDEQRRDDASDSTAIGRELILDILSRAHLPWKVLVEQVTGRDSFTGREFLTDEGELSPTYLGLRLPARTIYLLNKIPPLEFLDAANPGGVFGIPARRGLNGEVIDIGSLSVFGNERTRIRSRDYDVLDQNFALQLFRSAGLQIRTIDFEREALNTLDDIERTANQLERSINDIRREIALIDVDSTTISQSERDRLLQVRDERIHVWWSLRYDHARVLAWALDRGVTPRDALRELDSLRLEVRQLPDPNQETIDQLLIEALELRR